MTMFNWTGGQPAGPQPFTKDRYDAVLKSLDVNYAVDDDGDRFGDWEDMRLWFLAEGADNELLAMRAMWDVRPPVAAYDYIVEALNSWNRDHFWPKASVTRGEDYLGVFGDLVIDLSTGATDDFLRQQVRCMIGTSGQLFEYLAKAFPESAGDWFNAANG